MSCSMAISSWAHATRSTPSPVVGIAPQDLKYKGEPTRLDIGDDNTIRESVTISRGTAKGGGITRVGSQLPHHGLRPHRP